MFCNKDTINYFVINRISGRILTVKQLRKLCDQQHWLLILDEIQYAPEVVAAIKRHVDRDPHRVGQYLVTGSQQWQVLRSVSESLAGRAAFLDLYGFSLQEIANSHTGWLSRWLEAPDAFFDWSRQAALHETNLPLWLWRGSLPLDALRN